MDMLPRDWLPGKADSERQDSKKPRERKESNSIQDKSSKTNPRPAVDRAMSAAVPTPHDSVLAELQGQRPNVDTTAKIDAEPPALPTVPSVGSLEHHEASLGPDARSGTASPNASPEPIYDPFTGGLAFVFPSSHDRDSSPFEQAKDELWSQLGRIRELQSEIATMHTQMEGVGVSDTRKPKRGPARTHSDTIGGEEWPELAEVEQEQNKVRDAEFANLSQAFEGRHTAIGKIMDKLDELSKTLTAFHALPTPAMVFTSRQNTKETGTLYSNPSPTLSSPVSPSTISPTSGSPVVPPNVPNTLQAVVEKLEIPRGDSPEPI
ncbi:hypothetical protein BDY19DRAFT_62501 [Irpex rosettiformis]|uniref:Uncharacterized protein n=1 Tax=Irpex rosettiformis TaxID=378272 RepID=A0ACB8UL50_9APHY|nr:hypothetical protein BDY19DRAFT_62501 [Irpex rosettiformis]